MSARTFLRTILPLFALLMVPAFPLDAQQPPKLTPELKAYLDAAIDTLQRVSINRTSINWNSLRDSAYALSAGAREPRDLYPVVDFILRRSDKHSFLQVGWFGMRAATIEARFGYLRVPFWNSGASTLADSLQSYLKHLDVPATCGWVIDLRHNGGGNMWPMLAGIGPMLGDSIVGSIVDVDGRSLWKYQAGKSYLVYPDGRAEEVSAATIPPHTMRDASAPVAVLINEATASSGEVIAVAFRGRPNTRFFGTPTAGMSTSNRSAKLPDGANMVVTTGVYVDRLGNRYGQPIRPDVEVQTVLKGPTALLGDPVIATARDWLDVRCRAAASNGAGNP